VFFGNFVKLKHIEFPGVKVIRLEKVLEWLYRFVLHSTD